MYRKYLFNILSLKKNNHLMTQSLEKKRREKEITMKS
jgi:hypothetical protein